jgi:thiamine biosynthesis protein ThiS
MEIQVNGEPQSVPNDATVAWLIAHLKLHSKFVAVERNRELVPRARHAQCTLQAGDQIEIVTLVGGG